ncbi:MAG: hypothetical protein Q8P15_00510 [Nanoarchaeota archaeon]|nr:hypothetical protein [Nanoarchaeota archaeon]
MAKRKKSNELIENIDYFFDTENKVINVSGFNSEFIMEVDLKNVNGSYEIIRDDFQRITRERYEELSMIANGEGKYKRIGIGERISEDILEGTYLREILQLNKNKSHKRFDAESGRYFYTTASRI